MGARVGACAAVFAAAVLSHASTTVHAAQYQQEYIQDGLDVIEPTLNRKYDVGDVVTIKWYNSPAILNECGNPARNGTTPYASCCEKVNITLYKTSNGVSTVVPSSNQDSDKGKSFAGDNAKYGPSLVKVDRKNIFTNELNLYNIGDSGSHAVNWVADTTSYDNYSVLVQCSVPFWSNFSGFSPYFQINGAPTLSPSPEPTSMPTLEPTLAPSAVPTTEPSPQPTETRYPSPLPTAPTLYPTTQPSPVPTFQPYWSMETWAMLSFEVSNGQSMDFNSNQAQATKDAMAYFSSAVQSTSEITSGSWDKAVTGASDRVAFIFNFVIGDLETHGFNRTRSSGRYSLYNLEPWAQTFAEEECDKLRTDLQAAFASGNFSWYWRRKASDYGESLSAMKNIDISASQTNGYLVSLKAEDRLSVKLTRYIRPTGAPTRLPTLSPTTFQPTSTMAPTMVPTWKRKKGPRVMKQESALILGALFGGLLFGLVALAFAHHWRSWKKCKESMDCSHCLQEVVPEWRDGDEYPQDNDLFVLKRKYNMNNVVPEPYWVTEEQEVRPLKTADPWFQAKDLYDRDPIELERDDITVSTIGNMTRNIHRTDLAKGFNLGPLYHLKGIEVHLGAAAGGGDNPYMAGGLLQDVGREGTGGYGGANPGPDVAL